MLNLHNTRESQGVSQVYKKYTCKKFQERHAERLVTNCMTWLVLFRQASQKEMLNLHNTRESQGVSQVYKKYTCEKFQKRHDEKLNIPQCNSKKQAVLSLQKTAKVCRYIHRKMVDKIFQPPKSDQKWLEITNENLDWSTIYIIPFKVTLNQRLQYFQFRILHRIIGVNKLLFVMGIATNNRCSLCSDSIETISHLFWECNITKKFILQIQNSMLNDKIRMTKQLFLFGSNDVTLKEYNYIFLYAKYVLYLHC